MNPIEGTPIGVTFGASGVRARRHSCNVLWVAWILAASGCTSKGTDSAAPASDPASQAQPAQGAPTSSAQTGTPSPTVANAEGADYTLATLVQHLRTWAENNQGRSPYAWKQARVELGLSIRSSTIRFRGLPVDGSKLHVTKLPVSVGSEEMESSTSFGLDMLVGPKTPVLVDGREISPDGTADYAEVAGLPATGWCAAAGSESLFPDDTFTSQSAEELERKRTDATCTQTRWAVHVSLDDRGSDRLALEIRGHQRIDVLGRIASLEIERGDGLCVLRLQVGMTNWHLSGS